MPEIEALRHQPSTKLHPSAKTGGVGKQNDNNNNNHDSVEPAPEATPGQQQSKSLYADDAKKSAKIKELRKLVESKLMWFLDTLHEVCMALVDLCLSCCCCDRLVDPAEFDPSAVF